MTSGPQIWIRWGELAGPKVTPTSSQQDRSTPDMEDPDGQADPLRVRVRGPRRRRRAGDRRDPGAHGNRPSGPSGRGQQGGPARLDPGRITPSPSGRSAMTTTTFDPVAYKRTTRAQWEQAAEAWDRWGPTLEAW